MESKSRNPLWLRVLDLVTGGVLAGVISNLLSGGFSPPMTLFLLTYFYFGKAKYGPQGALQSLEDVKTSFFASVAWPILAWKKLDQDLQKPSSATYDAYVNEVHVGTLSDAEYSKIKRQVLRDPRLYFAQVMNLCRVAVKALDTFFLGIPILAFWTLFALAYFEPEAYATILGVLREGPDAISAAANRYMAILIQLWLVSLLVQATVRGHLPGFTNVFDAATTRLLRRQLGVAAEGDVILHRQVLIEAAVGQQQ